MIRTHYFFTLFLWICCTGLSFGQNDVYVMDSSRREDHSRLTDYIKYYYAADMPEDISGILSVDQRDFLPYNRQELSGLTSYWLKFTIQNGSGHNFPLWLIVGSVDYFRFYSPADSLNPVFGGNMTPEKELSFAGRSRYSVPVNVRPGRTKTYFLFVKGGFYGPPRLYMRLANTEQLNTITSRHTNNFWQGIFQGILWVMIVYNIFFTVIGRDKTYLYYALYMISVSIYFLNILGYLQDNVFPNQPMIGTYLLLIMQLGVIFYLVFIQKFLSLKKILPLWNRICDYLIVATFVLLIVKALYFIIFRKFGIFMYVSQIAVIMGAILTVGLIFALYRSKSILARYFMIGSIALGTGLVFSSFMSFSREAFSPAYFSSIQLGIVFEILFFSIGLSYKISENEKEKTRAQQKLIEQLKKNDRLQMEYAKELETKVEERTREISQQKNELESQTLKLEQLNEEKNHLIGIVAHDLRNPLTSALSMVNYLRENPGRGSEDLPETIGIVSSSLERMNSMIDKILDIRAIESQTMNISPEMISVPELLETISENFSVRAESKSIRIVKNLKPVSVRTDRNYLTQIMENLVSNAIKFSPEGKTVKLESFRSDGKAIISVSDEGPGFTEQDKKLLYMKYQRLSAKPTFGESSTGLGLSIVKKFMDALNGEIIVESEEGKGSEFKLVFNEAE